MNVNETESNDLLINDIFYKTGGVETRIPYDVLSGNCTLKPEDKEIQDWLQKKNMFKIEYVYKGRCINVEHGHYLEGIILYTKKAELIPNNMVQIKRELYSHFGFVGIDSKEHKEWRITPEESIFIIKLEDELKRKVDSFIYRKMNVRAKALGAGLEFTCFDLAKNWNEDYEYRLCYSDKNELKKHNDDGSNQRFKQELEKLIFKNNYFGIYDNNSPMTRFIVRR